MLLLRYATIKSILVIANTHTNFIFRIRIIKICCSLYIITSKFIALKAVQKQCCYTQSFQLHFQGVCWQSSSHDVIFMPITKCNYGRKLLAYDGFDISMGEMGK